MMENGDDKPHENGGSTIINEKFLNDGEGGEKENKGGNGEKEVEVTQVLYSEKTQNQKEINDYWEKVKGGPSRKIVKVKQEKTDTDNHYEVLGDNGGEKKRIKKKRL